MKSNGIRGALSLALRAGTLAGIMALSGCGADSSSEQVSDLDWAQSRSTTTRYAYLWSSDLQDEFLFGVNMIKVDGFLSNALNATVRPLKVKLKLKTTGDRKLDVVTSDTNETLMSFKVGVYNGKYEIDFASAGNDISLQQLVQQVGGVFTAENNDGYWLSEGTPVVKNVLQDNNTVVVDLEHTVSQVILGRTWFGRRYVKERVSEKPGKVVARLYLVRKKSLPALATAKKTVADGRSLNLGFFPSDFGATGADEMTLPIQRLPLGDVAPGKTLTYYLKDVPPAYQQVAKEAVESWNIAFGKNLIKAEIAPAHVDAGDPRYHVVKWFDGTDSNLRWAGVAKMLTNPDTGIVMGGTVYIQGDTLIKLYSDLVAFTHNVNTGGLTRLVGRIGNVSFENIDGETPVVPYFTDPKQTHAEYMQEYYRETIAHEVGHVLGLRHNFRGSTKLSAAGHSASVMDYLPRAERNKYEGPGSYDTAAVKWAYANTAPSAPQPFCTDEDLYKFYDCTQGDYGDPVRYVAHGLIDGTMFLAQKTVAVTDDTQISSMQGAYESALKILHLKSQLSAADRAYAESTLPDAMSYMETATPAPGLPSADRAVVAGNLTKLKGLADKAKQEMRTRGML
jgi:hypothetical protein